jgi:hypothetical protein
MYQDIERETGLPVRASSVLLVGGRDMPSIPDTGQLYWKWPTDVT